ncbi:type III-B CRISPR-associated protein Cas10/Cmr2 [Endozoicomonas sp. 2B-B]
MESKYFHITLGPVQGFVAQARRTRDFWAGSFLLSWLSGVAMVAVKKQEGDIKFPIPAEGYLEWLEGNGENAAPQQGSIPNRFKAVSMKVPADFNPEQVVQSIREAWQALAEHVWQKDLKSLDVDLTETRKIWDRQINNFWEISWCLSDEAVASNLLDRRKNWRTYQPPQEPGVKCMMMDGWQELSGAKRPGRAGQGERPFWKAVRQQIGKVDLRSGEELCAIAFVKRRFAHNFATFQAEMPGSWMLYGWQVPVNVPSVSYLAATHWLEETFKQAKKPEQWDAIWALHHALEPFEASDGHCAEVPVCIRKATEDHSEKDQWQRFDGQYLFDFILQSKGWQEPDWQPQMEDVYQCLKKVQQITDSSPSPFYAVLLMDGDSLGSQMSDPEKQVPISQALNQFTSNVSDIVRKHNGFLVYAGGDDVLALLPMEDAMPCALALRSDYLECFRKFGKGMATSTLSGAIEYCHVKSPLMKGLFDAHGLLDDIAKDQTGRDSLAVRVWKPGGLHLEWSCPWEKVLNGNKLVINQLASKLCHTDAEAEQDQKAINGFAWGFFQKAEKLFKDMQLNKGEDVLPVDAVQSLLTAMYLHTGQLSNKDQEAAGQLAKELISQCQLWVREYHGKDSQYHERAGLSIDALKLVRFLVTKGQDKEGQAL